MDFTEKDIAEIRKQGDLVSFMGLVAGFRAGKSTTATDRPCKHCGARPGQKCTTKRGKPIESGVHPSRETDENPNRNTTPGAWPVTRPDSEEPPWKTRTTRYSAWPTPPSD